MNHPSTPRLSRIECLAPELLSKIALFVALYDNSQLGPPSCILPLTRTSRSLHRAIAFGNNAYLLAGLFRARFDDGAFARRTRTKMSTTSLGAEYRKRCETLQRIRTLDIHETTLIEDLWTVYLIFIEHDEKNLAHLIWANLHRYLMKFLRSLDLNVQQVLGISSKETTALSLGIYLLHYISNAGILYEETSEDRKFLIDILEALVVCGFRLPSFYVPDADFHVQGAQVQQSSLLKVRKIDSQLFPVPKISCITAYGYDINLRPPPIFTSAFLALVERYEVAQELKGPQVFEPSLPVDRAAANTLGVAGPTQADITEIASRIRNKLPGMRPRGTDCYGRGTSQNHDGEWYQVTSCLYPSSSGLRSSSLKLPQGRAFVPGQLCGLWAGKFMVPERLSYRKLINHAPQSPVENVCMYQRPMYMRLREHHFLDDGSPSSSISDPDPDPNGLLRAWFPIDSVLAEDREGAHLDLYCPTSQTRTRYETYFPAQEGSGAYPGIVANKSKQKNSSRRPYFACSPRCIPNECLACEGNVVAQPSGVADVLITGETDNDHAQAWGHFTFTGRVRLWDGLIALLRRPTNPEDSGLGTWIFRGYISPSGVLIGRWRETATGMDAPGWEGPFFLTKQSDKLES